MTESMKNKRDELVKESYDFRRGFDAGVAAEKERSVMLFDVLKIISTDKFYQLNLKIGHFNLIKEALREYEAAEGGQ